MIAWGSPHAEVPLQPAQHQVMEAALQGFEWLRVFPGCVVVSLQSITERTTLQERLATASQTLSSNTQVLISPPMLPGTGIYNGYLASNLWEELNKKAT